jgi:hypothetical protein
MLDCGVVNRSVGLYLVLAAVLLGTTFTLTLAADTKTKQTVFSYLGVPAMPLPFNDLYGVLAWGDCAALGEDLTKGCSVAPIPSWPMNYPQTWFVFKNLGLFIKDVNWLGVLIDLSFALSTLVLVWGRRIEDTWLLFLLLPTQPIWLILERCNLDLVIYLVVLALGYASPPVAFALITGGISLKYYPIGAAAVFLNRRLPIMVVWVVAIVVATALFILTPYSNWNSAQAGVVVTQSYFMSYGWKVLPALIEAIFVPEALRPVPLLNQASFVLMLGISLAGCYVAWKWPYQRPTWTEVERRWFQASLGVFLVCFGIGYSYDYRYALLLPAVPALTVSVRQKGWRSAEGAFVGLLILACWLAFPSRFPKVALVQELMNWGLLAFAVPLVLWSRQAPEASPMTEG